MDEKRVCRCGAKMSFEGEVTNPDSVTFRFYKLYVCPDCDTRLMIGSEGRQRWEDKNGVLLI